MEFVYLNRDLADLHRNKHEATHGNILSEHFYPKCHLLQETGSFVNITIHKLEVYCINTFKCETK